jgi:hypothetical protein
MRKGEKGKERQRRRMGGKDGRREMAKDPYS